MVTIAIEGSNGSELTYEFEKQMITVGASNQNDVAISAPGVAPRHLVIQRNGNVFTFIAQNRQVAVLNGERRSRGVLRVGDRVRLGSATMIFKGVTSSEVEVDLKHAPPREQPQPASTEEPAQRPQTGTKARTELVLYSEPHRLAEARRHMVEIFRPGVRSNLVPPLRTFFDTFFVNRQAMLARLDNEGALQPIVSSWTGEVPRLPARTFEELRAGGRFAALRMPGREVLIYPVDCGMLQIRAFLVAETGEGDQQDDTQLLAELARTLATNWERVESSSSLLGAWESAAREEVEKQLPGSSHGIRVLRDSVIQAARTSHPVLICGRPASGRVTVASLVAAVHASGPLAVEVVQAREGEDDVVRLELFGGNNGVDGVTARARGGAIVLRDLHLLSPPVQRELAATIRHDLDTGYGPSVRWMGTTEADCMALLTDGRLDSTLFAVFHRHIMRVPALEERREDLPLLIVRLLESLGGEQGKEIRGIQLETLNSLLNHSFEGQMTELVAELRRLVSATPDGEMVRGLVPAITGEMPAGAAGSQAASLVSQDDLKTVIPAVERMIIDRVLRRTLGNQSKAARVLNLSRGALIAKMKEFDIPDYRYLRRGRG